MTAAAMIELETWIIYQCVLNECGSCTNCGIFLPVGSIPPHWIVDRSQHMNNEFSPSRLMQDFSVCLKVPEFIGLYFFFTASSFYFMVSTTMEHGGGGGGSAWCAREISLRAQKKLLSRVGGAASARALILDEHAARLLDQLLRVLRTRTDKKEAEKMVKHVIKSAVKLGVLRRHGQLSSHDERALDTFRAKFHTLMMAVISFCEVEFSYDRDFLQSALRDSHQALKSVIERHLSEKSVSRLAGVFALVSRDELLDSMFSARPPDQEVVTLTRMLRRSLDQGLL